MMPAITTTVKRDVCSESERRRCKNGATCIVDVQLEATSCVCIPGFTDANCTTGLSLLFVTSRTARLKNAGISLLIGQVFGLRPAEATGCTDQGERLLESQRPISRRSLQEK